MQSNLVISDEQKQLIKRQFAPKTSDSEFQFFLHIAQGLDLDPRVGQVWAVPRNVRQADGSYRTQHVIQIGVAGLRALAMRTGQYESTAAVEYCDANGEWSDVWLDEKHPPRAARTRVYRKGDTRGTSGLALYSEFSQDTPIWRRMPVHMLGLAAERLALKRAFQHDLAGVYEEAETHGMRIEEVELPDYDAPPPAIPAAPARAALPEPAKPRVDHCRSCGMAIIWGETASGALTPFDVDADGYPGESHFKTCPHADDWSRKGRTPRTRKAAEPEPRPEPPAHTVTPSAEVPATSITLPPAYDFSLGSVTERWAKLEDLCASELSLGTGDLVRACHGTNPRDYAVRRYQQNSAFTLNTFWHELVALVYDRVPLPSVDPPIAEQAPSEGEEPVF